MDSQRQVTPGEADVITIFDGDDWVTVYDGDDLIWCDHPSGSGMWRVYESLGRDVFVYEVSTYAGGLEGQILSEPPGSFTGVIKLAAEMGYDISEPWGPGR